MAEEPLNPEPDEPVAMPEHEPRTPRRGGCLRRLGCVLFLIVLLAGAGGAGGYWALERWARTPFGVAGTHLFRIEPGMRSRDAAARLRREGVVGNDLYFLAWLRLHDRAHQIQAGDFQVALPIAPARLIDILAHGRFERVLTIPEGWTARQIARRLLHDGWIKSEQEWLDLVERPVGGDVLGEAAPQGAEGFCYPETYRLEAGTKPEEILRRMLTGFRAQWAQARPALRGDGATSLTTRELVTLASLIQREARSDAEMPTIASVYYNRLRRGMKLQCDATVHYALGEVWDRALTYADLKIDSPYNTYMYNGLPPGPIANPGRPALEAALRPAQTDFIFYVWGGGPQHIYSRTAAEHEKAVREARRRLTAKVQPKLTTDEH